MAPRLARAACAPFALAALAALSACADRAPAPAPLPSTAADVVIIEGARVFDGERDLGVMPLVLRDGRIEAVGGDAPLPAGARRVDYAGRYIVPGLVSDHAHLGNTEGVEHGGRYYTRDHVVRDLRQFQAFGVTTVTSLGMNGEAFYEIRDAVRAGEPALGAWMLGAGPGIGAPGGAPPAKNMGLAEDAVPRPADAAAARETVREQARRGVDIVKLWVDDLGGQAPPMAPEVYRAAIEEAHARGLRVAAHIHDLAPAADLVASGIDVIAHGVRDRPVDAALVEAMRRRGTWYVPTLQIDEANYLYAERPQLVEEEPALRAALQAPLRARFEDLAWRRQQLDGEAATKSRAAVRTNLDNLRTLHEAGVRIGFGTDAGALPHRVIGFAEHRELELMTQAGFTPEQALRTATRDAAELLGLDDRGRLAPGRRADFVVLDADPLQDIRNTRRIRAVWQAGREAAGPLDDFDPDRNAAAAPRPL